jgi:hypothetical protein
MKKPGKQQIWLAICCLVSAFVALQNTDGFEGTEFSGGWLTGPLLSMVGIGTVLFLLAFVVGFLHPRVAAAIALVSWLLCLPLCLYFTAPVPFNQIFGFGHEFKVQPSGGFHWQSWTIAGALTFAITTYVCLRGFAATGRVPISERG